MKRRGFWMACAIALAAALAGCSQETEIKAGEYEASTLAVGKGNVIRVGMIEDFDKDYYEEGELEAYLTDKVDSYNEEHGEGAVSMTSFQVEDGKASAVLEYRSIEDYAEHMGADAQLLTVAEARESGILDGLSFLGPDGGEAALEEAASDEGMRALVLHEELDVILYEDFAYCANCSINGKRSVHTDPGKVSVILFP